MSYFFAASLVLSLLLLSACGNKGDLELVTDDARALSQQAIDRLSDSDDDQTDEDDESDPSKKPRPQQAQ